MREKTEDDRVRDAIANWGGEVIVPLSRARNVPIGIAARNAARYTKNHGREAGFLYNTKTGKVVSAIIGGREHEIDIAPMTVGHSGKDEDDGLGFFHVHPGTDKLRFSPRDIINSGEFGFKESAVANADRNTILFAKSPRSLPENERPRVREKLKKIDEDLYKRDKMLDDILHDKIDSDDQKNWDSYYDLGDKILRDVDDVTKNDLGQKRLRLKNFSRRGLKHVQKSRKR